MRSKILGTNENNQNELADVPACYRAWSQWVFRCDSGGWQILQIKAARAIMSERETLDALCEVLSRSTFEVAMGLHFDQVDSKVDKFVYGQIHDFFGERWAQMVAVHMAEHGSPCRFAVPKEQFNEHTDKVERLVPIEVETYQDGDPSFAEHEAAE